MQGNRFVERISELAQFAGTALARDVLADMRQSLEAGDDPSGWIEAVQLCRESTLLSDDAAYYLLVIIAEAWAFRACDDDLEIQRLTRAMNVIERREGLLDDEAFPLGGGPPDYEQLRSRWDNRFDSMQSSLLRRHGEAEVALAVLLDDDTHRARVADGNAEIIASDDDGSD